MYTDPASPSSATLSHRVIMISQFSAVRFSSVALTVGDNETVLVRTRRILTDYIIVWVGCTTFEHCCSCARLGREVMSDEWLTAKSGSEEVNYL